MPRLRTIALRFPAGGLDRRHAYASQAPYTVADCNNFWPTDWGTGRERGATRPGLTATGASLGAGAGVPYNWVEAVWVDTDASPDTPKRGVAVTTATGTYITVDGVTWVEHITTNPGTAFSCPAVYLQTLFQARYGDTTLYRNLDGSAGAGTALGSHPQIAIDSLPPPPTDCGIVCAHGDALWLAGSRTNAQTVYRSRQGAFWDFDTSAVDPGASWNSSGPEGGIIGKNVTALLSHGNECLLVGCISSLYTILGNPKANGRTKVLSNYVGPLMQSAWCKGPDDRTYMMTGDGLFRIDSACASYPYSISGEQLPAELRNISPGAGDFCSIGYDRKFRGVHIYVDYASGGDVHFFYNLQEDRIGEPPKGGFWPMSFASTLRLCPHLDSAQTSTKSALLPINATGTVYQFDTASAEAIDSYLDYGAIKLAPDGREGVLYSVQGAISENSGDVAISGRYGHTPTEAFAATGESIGTMTRSSAVTMNHKMYAKRRGAACYLRIEDVSQSKIGVEELLLTVGDGGMLRIT